MSWCSSINSSYLWGVTFLKDDSAMAVQWVIWHLLLGFGHLLIYDNNSTDNLSDALYPFVQAGYVTRFRLLEIRGQHSQQKSYRKALTYAKRNKVKWLMAFDVDEFVSPGSSQRCALPKLLMSLESNASIGGLALNWRWIPSYGHIWRNRSADGTIVFSNIIEQSNFSTGVANHHVKTIVYTNRTVGFTTVHHAHYVSPAIAVSPTRLHHVASSVFDPPDISRISLLHYHTRTFEEFLYRIRRWQPSHFESHCPNCDANITTIGLEYLNWLNSTNVRGIQTYHPQLSITVPPHKKTRRFLETMSKRMNRIIKC